MVINPSLDALTACRKEYFNKLNHKPKQTTTPPRPADPWQTLRHTSNRSCHTTRSPWNIITHWSQFLFTFYAHMFASVPSLIPHHPPSIQSHDQPNPEAISTSLSLTPSHLVYPSLSPPFPHPTRLSPDARTILQCAFGPRCGRAALSESLPPNNAKEPGVSLTDSTRRILPPAPPHPFPWPASPNKHPPPPYPPRSIC